MNQWIKWGLCLSLLVACNAKQSSNRTALPQAQESEPTALADKHLDAASCETLWQALLARDAAALDKALLANIHPHCLNQTGEWPLFFIANVWTPWKLVDPSKADAVEAELKLLTGQLLRHGADPNYSDGEKASALYMAVFFDLPILIEKLLAAGGDPLQGSPTGLNALELSQMMGHSEAETLLRGALD